VNDVIGEEKKEEEEQAEKEEEEETAMEAKAEEEKEEEKEEKKELEEKEEEPEEKKERKKAKKLKKKKKAKGVRGRKARAKGEDVEIVEELPKIKPKISKEVKELLALRRALKSKKPDFRRQEWFRYVKLGTSWRRPRGRHSKMRRHFKRRPNVVSIGYGSPSSARFYHPSGFLEKLVHNVKELEDIDPKTHAVRIAHSVGAKKRFNIIEKADEEGIKVLNRGMMFEEEEEKKAPKEEKEKEKPEAKPEGKSGGKEK